MLAAPTDDLAEWGRKIIEVYMMWYTFFMTTNVLLLGWFAGRDSRHYDAKPMTAVSVLFVILNLLGSVSTGFVAYSVGGQAPDPYKLLIHWAGVANIGGLFGNVFLWIYLARVRRNVTAPKPTVDLV
jgi:hypothetical protein